MYVCICVCAFFVFCIDVCMNLRLYECSIFLLHHDRQYSRTPTLYASRCTPKGGADVWGWCKSTHFVQPRRLGEAVAE